MPLALPRPGAGEKKEGALWVAVTMVGASEEGIVVQGGGFTGATLSDQSQTRPAPPTPRKTSERILAVLPYPCVIVDNVLIKNTPQELCVSALAVLRFNLMNF